MSSWYVIETILPFFQNLSLHIYPKTFYLSSKNPIVSDVKFYRYCIDFNIKTPVSFSDTTNKSLITSVFGRSFSPILTERRRTGGSVRAVKKVFGTALIYIRWIDKYTTNPETERSRTLPQTEYPITSYLRVTHLLIYPFPSLPFSPGIHRCRSPRKGRTHLDSVTTGYLYIFLRVHIKV